MTHLKLQAARLILIKQYPYLASALMRMPMVENENAIVEGRPTMGVDAGWRCHYHPAFVEMVDVDTLATIILHELYHLLREHHSRRNGRDARLWNIATDMEINDDLLQAGHRFGWLDVHTPAQHGLPAGELAEWYYQQLCQHSQQQGDGAGAGAGEGSSSQQSAPNSTASQTSPSSTSTVPPQTGATPNTSDTSDAQWGGSCSDGVRRAWEGEGEGEAGDAPAVSEAEAELIRREVARRITETVKNRGTVPAGLKRWAEEQLALPKVDWRRELAATIRRAVNYRAGMVDYSYRRPNRRYRGKLVLPGMVAPEPEVAIIIDTSGSMSDRELSVALSEVQGILRTLGYGATIITADAQVQTVARVQRANKVELAGGGGTDMAKAIDFAMSKLQPRPDVVVVLTDGFTPWPSEPPRGVRVVVALVGQSYGSAPDWARVVRVEVEQ